MGSNNENQVDENGIKVTIRGSGKKLKEGVEQREEEILGDVQISEIQVTINGLLNNKSPGIDHIPNEFLKYSTSNFKRILTKFLNKILKECKIPMVWKESITTLIPKVKGTEELDKKRGITVNSCVGKVLFKLIQKRMMANVEERGLLGSIQHGFQSNYQTIDALLHQYIL